MTTEAEAERYRDRRLVVNGTTLTIGAYYFPWTGAKSVPLAHIQGVERVPLTAMGGRWRLWGSTTPSYWANLDTRRPGKEIGFVLDLGGRVRPFVTPDDPDAFEAALKAAVPEVPFAVQSTPRYGV